MRTILLLNILLFLISCRDKQKGINFVVSDDKEDTLSHFYYDGHKRYLIFGENGLDSAFSSQTSKNFLRGQLRFGIKDRIEFINRFLVFRSKPTDEFETLDKPHIPFLREEYFLPAYEVVMFENYVDSLQSPLRKFETQIAIDKKTRDTLLFQEANYVMKDSDLITSFIVYDNYKTREEMRLLLNDVVKTIKISVKDTPK